MHETVHAAPLQLSKRSRYFVCVRPPPDHCSAPLRQFFLPRMIPKDSDSSYDGDWDDPEELGWTEFEWEKYLRSQDAVVERYLTFYSQSPVADDRLDVVARQMGWENPDETESEDPSFSAEEEDSAEFEEGSPYTVQRNPAFVALSALYKAIDERWLRTIDGASEVPASLALSFQSALFRGERQALIGIHSLDLGDFTLAIAQFKRAMRELNETMRIVTDDSFSSTVPLASFRLGVMSSLFDLREVLLRVLRECREEIARHPGSSGDGEDDGESRG